MNLTTVHYSLLKYRPSLLLDEQVNIGIFFHFKEEETLKFIYPSALSRLNSLFPEVDINRIKNYLKYFKEKVTHLSKNKEAITILSTDKLIAEHLLVPDSNAFFFGPTKTTLYKDIPELLTRYNKDYFAPYFDVKEDTKHSDKYLLQLFAEKIESRSFAPLFKKNIQIANKKGVTANFEYAWQNGHVNLIKPLSFDLVQKSSIQEKSVKWFGYISQLEKEATVKNLVFNFLLAKPRDKKLLSSFEEAVSILSEKEGLVELVYEEKLDAYLKKAAETITVLDWEKKDL